MILDGLDAATDLHRQGKVEASRTLLRDVILRVLLDDSMLHQEVQAEQLIETSNSTGSARFDTRGLLTILSYGDLHDLPPEMFEGLLEACANPWTHYSDAERLLHAARIQAKAGARQSPPAYHEVLANVTQASGLEASPMSAALAYYRRYFLATVPAFESRDIGLADRRKIAEMRRVRGLVAAREGTGDAAALACLRLVQLDPANPRAAMDLVAVLQEMGATKTIVAARAWVDGFWRVRHIEIPSSETYLHWQKEWDAVFAAEPP